MKPRHLTLAATLSGALVAPTGAQAHPSQLERSYEHAYRAVVRKLGTRAPGRNIVRWGTTDHHRAPSWMILRSLRVLHRMLHPAPVIPAPSPATVTGTPAPSSAPASSSQTSSGGLSSVPGVPASFAACVAMRESSNGAGSSNIYGILGPGGQGSLAEQKAAFSSMYAARGTQPWAPYDHC